MADHRTTYPMANKGFTMNVRRKTKPHAYRV